MLIKCCQSAVTENQAMDLRVDMVSQTAQWMWPSGPGTLSKDMQTDLLVPCIWLASASSRPERLPRLGIALQL